MGALNSWSLFMKLFLFLFIGAALFLTSCGTYEHSAVITAPAVVVDTGFNPSGSAASMDTDGNVATDSYPAEFTVVFRCDNGLVFTVAGSEPKHAELWKKMAKGLPVTVSYCAVFFVTKKGKSLDRHEFIDAAPITLGEL